MHQKGFIRSCDLVRTEDVPLLSLGPETAAAAAARSAATTTPAAPGGRKEGSSNPSSSPPSSSSSPSPSSSSNQATTQPLFDPSTIDLNATTLLRFLKANCWEDGKTYLLHREEGGHTLALYDVTALSAHRQKRWKWLLAMLSYRFAMRLYQQAHLLRRRKGGREGEREGEEGGLERRHRALLQTCFLLL